MKAPSTSHYLLFLSLLSFFACHTTKNTVAPSAEDISIKIPVRNHQAGRDKFPFLRNSDAEDRWVDSIYKRMSFPEKVGQLFMVAAYSNKDSTHVNAVEKLVTDYHIGGLIFFQGGPYRQATLTNRFQSKAKLPLFIGIDAEWGLSMRLDSTYRFPWNMTLGAIKDKSLLEKAGRQMGLESNRMGIHFNFAPVLDINTNPKNPIIGFRSFGEDKQNVTASAVALMKGVQNQGVFSTGKHFPGHGDTETDSHYTLPLVNFSKERINDVELYPYKELFNEGLVSVMVAHLAVPSIEPRQNYPSSVSYNVVTDLLQKELGFEGLIFTDALNMKAAANHRAPGEIDLDAFLAGNDILLFSESVPTAIDKICEAYYDGRVTEERLAASVKKILHYKYKAGLHQYKPVSLAGLKNDINPAENEALQYTLFENAVTVLKNTDGILPVYDLSQKIAYVKLGDDTNSAYINTLKTYADVTEVADTNIDSLLVKLKQFDLVIAGFHKSDRAWRSHDLSPVELEWIKKIADNNKLILDVFTKPYTLSAISDFSGIEGLLLSYQNADVAQRVSAGIVFGAHPAKGQLPVTVNEDFPVNFGLETNSLDRLSFTHPLNAGMDPVSLQRIDAVVDEAIRQKMTPGAQVLVARNGKVIFRKSYGYHTYEAVTKVANDDLYDVASLTKILSTLPALMQLYDQGKINGETLLGDMLSIFKGTDKENITFNRLLSHYAGFEAWNPFYKATLDASGKPSPEYYRKTFEPPFTKQVADSLFAVDTFNQRFLKSIAEAKLAEKVEYKYSDYTFIILKEYLEQQTGKSLDLLTFENFYHKMGAGSTMFNPLQRYSKTRIPPTEVDTYFRHQTVQGYVHDMAAAMLGGVSGHAGLFSNATDVAKIMQMFLQKGTYGGVQYFKPETFDYFNTCHFCAEGNRRGLGFDKQQLPGSQGPTCGCVSDLSFGHTGFTGTYAWADPVSGLVYVFLSNRSFPDSTENKLSKANVRERIQKIIQESIIK